MANAEKILEKMKRSHHDHSNEDIRVVLVALGCMVSERTKTTAYQHEVCTGFRFLTYKHQTTVDPWVIQDLLDEIEKHGLDSPSNEER